MPRKLPPFLHRETTRHGRSIWYFRRGKGTCVRLPDAFGSVEFWAAYEAAAKGACPQRQGHASGTFSAALRSYYASQTWAALRPATQRMKRHVLNGVDSVLGKSKLKDWKRGDIAAGRDKRAATPAAAEMFVKSLRSFFAWALEAGLVLSNPTDGVKVVASSTDGFAPWTDDDVAAYRARWPLGTRQRIAFEVLHETGLRRGDAVRIGLPNVRDRIIRIATEKTGERVAIVISDILFEAIEAGPVGQMTFIVGATGKPMKKELFGTIFREWCDAAGVSKSAHGLRKAAATADALAGYTDAELDAKFGWTGRKMASHYTRNASRERLSISAAARVKSRTEVPSPSRLVRD